MRLGYWDRKVIELTEIPDGPADFGLCHLNLELLQDGVIELWLASESGPGPAQPPVALWGGGRHSPRL